MQPFVTALSEQRQHAVETIGRWDDKPAMLRALLLSAFLVAGCHQGKPKWTDDQIRMLQADNPGMTPACVDKLRWGGPEALPKNDDECYQFTLPMRMQGLWRNDFEGSVYCESSARQCPDRNVAESSTWLEMKQPLAGWNDTAPGGLYAIDFIGRRSLSKGMFGHFGMFNQEVIVDHLLSISEAEPPPPQPTKAQMVQEMKECERRRTCIPNWSFINEWDDAQMKKAHIDGYLKDCAGKQICMPNSEVGERR